jgi:hypothetical protein
MCLRHHVSSRWDPPAAKGDLMASTSSLLGRPVTCVNSAVSDAVSGEVVGFTMKNGDFTMKNGDFTMKNGGFTMKNDGFTIFSKG